MDKVSKAKIKKLIHRHALLNNMTDAEFEKLINSPYEFAAEKIKELKLDDIETEEEFDKVKTNFIFTSFFKLVIDFRRIQARNNRRNNINKKINNKNGRDN